MELPSRRDEAARVLHEVRDGLLEPVEVAQHVGRLADDLGVRLAVAQDGLERVEHAGRQLAQVHARKLHGGRVVLDALQGQQVMGEAAQALALVDDDAAELLVQLGRQIGVFQHFGVAADGGERRAQLVSHVADEGRLSALFQREVVLLRLHGLDEALEVGGQLVGFEKAAVRLERHVGARAVRGGPLRQKTEGFRNEMPDDQAERKHRHTDGDEQQKRLRREVEGEEANQEQYRAGEEREQRCQQREVCLQSFYCLNLYP